MPRQPILLLPALLFLACSIAAQVTTTAQNITVQVSTAEPWTDSGLDLKSGDVLEISAAASRDQPVASGVPACDPAGVTETAAAISTQTANLPLPSAPAGALIARLHAHGAAALLVGASREFHIAEPSHLVLGMNMSGSAPCQGPLAVTVHVIPAGSSLAATTRQPAEAPRRATQIPALRRRAGLHVRTVRHGQVRNWHFQCDFRGVGFHCRCVARRNSTESVGRCTRRSAAQEHRQPATPGQRPISESRRHGELRDRRIAERCAGRARSRHLARRRHRQQEGRAQCLDADLRQ